MAKGFEWLFERPRVFPGPTLTAAKLIADSPDPTRTFVTITQLGRANGQNPYFPDGPMFGQLDLADIATRQAALASTPKLQRRWQLVALLASQNPPSSSR